jgi:hypothetical protein
MDDYRISSKINKDKNLKKVRSVIAKYKNKSIDNSNSSYVSKACNISIVSIGDENKISDICKRNESE